jgi:hypothetical protein
VRLAPSGAALAWAFCWRHDDQEAVWWRPGRGVPSGAVERPQEGDVDEDLVEREVAIACLSEVWSQLGFEHFREGVYVLDLDLHLDESLEQLAQR